MFDPKTYEAPPVESETRRNLRELSRLLRHPEEWPEGHEWDFWVHLDTTPCGTVGCAIGLWAVREGIEGPGVHLARFFPSLADEESFRGIFMGDAYAGHDTITPTMVADKIDQYLRDNPEV